MKVAAAVLMVVIPAAVLGACRSGPVVGSDLLPECEVVLTPPEGFEPLETFRETFADHEGVRLGFADRRGRELHAFAGIPGEFGEGLPAAGEIELTGGRTGLLSGSARVWVLQWYEGDVCDPRAALGNGFGREGFVELLTASGIAAGSN